MSDFCSLRISSAERTSENSVNAKFAEFPFPDVGCIGPGAASFPMLCPRTYVQSRSWLSEHLRSNLWEDAVGLSSCRTSENNPSTHSGELASPRVQRGEGLGKESSFFPANEGFMFPLC